MNECMSYNEAIELLSNALKFGINPSLEPIRAMCEALRNPQLSYECVQVAGSNGKSSTTRMIAALLHEQGLKVGLYTSPHLVEYPERVEINGDVVGDELFARGVSAAAQAADDAGVQATEFELLTAAALWIFAHEDVDWAVLECGLGGRWDATSVVDPKVAVITGVALEHTQILGDTVEKIAAEKAAIIKAGSTAVLACGLDAREVFEAQARRMGAPVVYANAGSTQAYESSLAHLPSYQLSNAATSLAAVTAAIGELDTTNAHKAFAQLVVPGRFEILRDDPLLIVDAAHNPQSAETLAKELSARYVTALSSGENATIPTLLIGVLADKDARGIVRALCPLFMRVVATASSSPRALSARELAAVIEEETGKQPEIVLTLADAKRLLAEDAVIATGSITVAGEVKRIW